MQKTLSSFGIGVFLLPVFLMAQAVPYQIIPNHTADSSIPPTVTITPDVQLQSQCVSCSYTAYRLVRQLNCGATVAIEDVLSNKPTCKMVPRVSTGGAVMLEWDTIGARVAFIDAGVGHVEPSGGARIVTPTSGITYSMTVVNSDGLVGVCSAIVNVSNANAQIQELLVLDDDSLQNTDSVQEGGTYAYNETAVNYDTGNGDSVIESKESAQSMVIAHTATMRANGTPIGTGSFFTSGLFLTIAFLVVLIMAVWLIIRHGVR